MDDNCVVVCPMPIGGTPSGFDAVLRDSFSIAVDAGLKHFKTFKHRPTVWVGDGDSIASPRARAISARPAQTVKLKREKDYSDFEAALQIAGHALIEGAWQGDLILLGAQGGRFDHEFGILLSTQSWLQAMVEQVGRADCPDVVCYGPRGMWLATSKGTYFEQPTKRVFSMFSLVSDSLVSLRGAKYGLRRRILDPGAHGISNEGLGKTVKLTVHEGGPVFLLFV